MTSERHAAARNDLGIGPGASRNAQRTSNESTYLRWCEANGQPPLPVEVSEPTGPSPETVLLRFLHSMVRTRDWKHVTCAQAAVHVAQFVTAAGHPDPRGPRVKAWLKARLRETGKRTTRPVDALTVDEVRQGAGSAEAAEPDKDDALLRRRAVLALADLLSEDGVLAVNPLQRDGREQALREIPIGSFDLRQDAVRVTTVGGVQVISAHRTPVHFEVITEAVSRAQLEGLTYPLYPAAAQSLAADVTWYARNQDQGSFLRGLRRLDRAVPRSEKDRISAKQGADWWARSTREQRLRLMARLDGSLSRRTQDLAYALTGITNLHRNAELVRLNIEHMVARADGSGYDYVLLEHKSSLLAARWNSVPQPVLGALDHIAKPGSCLPVCPACAMDRHLMLRREDGAQPQDPLFVNHRVTSEPRRMASTSLGSRVMKQLAAIAPEDDAERRIGSRTMRVTGATWLRAAGVSYAELQEAGGWSSPVHAAIYVRRHDPWASSLVLSIGAGPLTEV